MVKNRHIFAISDLDTSKEFVKRCKRKNWAATTILVKFMRLFNAGLMDEVISKDEEEEKSNDGQG